MKKYLTLLLLGLFLISFAIAGDFNNNKHFNFPSNNLNDLDDVSTINPQDKQVILFNQTSNSWYSDYVNSSLSMVNNSVYWDGHAYTDEGHWETDGTNVWRSSDFVGIGTNTQTVANSPMEIRSATGAIQLVLGYLGDSTRMHMGAGTNDFEFDMKNPTAGGNAIVWKVNGNTEMAIQSDGDVVIDKTLTTGDDINIVSATSPTLLVKDTTNDVEIRMRALDTTAFFGTASDHPFDIRTNNTAAINIDTSQNVGLGTATPSYDLHIEDTGLPADLYLDRTDGSDLYFKAGGTYSNFGTLGNHDFRIRSNNVDRFMVKAIGDIQMGNLTAATPTFYIDYDAEKVGIGTSSPSEKLEVNGNILANSTSSEVALILSRDQNIAAASFFGRIDWKSLGGTTVARQRVKNVDGDELSGQIEFSTADGGALQKQMVIGKDGKVGIGTDSPDQLLEIENVGGNAYAHIDAGGTAGLFIDRTGTAKTAYTGYLTDGAFNWYTGLTDSDAAGTGNEYFIGQSVGGTNAAIYIDTSNNLEINGDTIPKINNTYSLGSLALRWLKGWFIDLDVSNDLIIGGDLNVTGKIHNSLSHLIGYVTTVHTTAIVDTWYNLTFNETLGDSEGITFEDNRTVIIPNDGHYTITFGIGYQDSSPSPNSHVAQRITVNGNEMLGSYIEEDIINRQSADDWIEHTTHADLNTGDELNMQYIASDTDVTIQTDGTYATQNYFAYGYIQEVIV